MNRKIIPTLSHPFMNGLKELPLDKEEDLKEIRLWMDGEPHLPYISDDYIYLFLHACYYQHEKTKNAIETYFTIRANTPSIFGDRNVYSDSMEFTSKLASLFKFPKKTPDGYTVMMYLVNERESTEYIFSDALKGFSMFNDCIISEDGLAKGYIVIFDMKNAKFGHLTRITLPALRAFMAYIQDGHPARLKAIHVINTAAFIKQIMRLVTPMIRTELMGLVKFHRGSIPEGIPQEIFPKDFGGEAPSSQELSMELFRLRDKYSKWLLETEYFVADESKRVRKGAAWWSFFTAPNQEVPNSSSNNNIELKDQNAFRQLEID
ncbi:hypothetical protein RI129_012763 [Pyrocoelia pectoralis]|uniref:CRAL-TRIO domain-containing protein n=1 Tax=Pyrocoelia pectoralis TaxID=417401 RepID=A0AAN7ZGH3_9COLE